MWNTKQISRSEFQDKVIPAKFDSLQLELQIGEKHRHEIGSDSFSRLIISQQDFLEKEHQLYLDTVQSEFVKEINPDIIEEL